MKRPCYVRADGVSIRQGDWVETEMGIGRFAGIWQNETLGCTTELTLYRTFAEPDERSSVFLTLNDQRGLKYLDRAQLVDGPLKSNGRRPSRHAVEPTFKRDGWTPGPVDLACAGAEERLRRFGWVARVAFGIIEIECDPLPVIQAERVVTLTHLPTGRRFGVFETLDLAADMAEIAMRLADWATLTSMEAAESSEWRDLANRMFAAWTAAGLRSASNVTVLGADLLVHADRGGKEAPSNPAIRELLARLIEELKPYFSADEGRRTLEQCLEVAPANHPAHRIMCTSVRCQACGSVGTLRDVKISTSEGGGARCAKCDSFDISVVPGAEVRVQ